MGDRKKNIHRTKPPSRRAVLFNEDDPRDVASLAIYYAELARALAEDDAESAAYARDCIRELLTATEEDFEDVPLSTVLRKRKRASK
jgi:hypothetical protein